MTTNNMNIKKENSHSKRKPQVKPADIKQLKDITVNYPTYGPVV